MDLDPLGTAMGWLAAYGVLGLLLVSLAERFVPVMPSYGMLVAVGIAAAEGRWSPTEALLASAAGSVLGSILFFALARSLGPARSRRLVHATGRPFRLRPATIDRWMARLRERQGSLAFATQLVPVVRLLAPGLAGIARLRLRTFLLATTAGVLAWNGVFIGIGYAGGRLGGDANASVLALATLIALLAVEGAVLLVLGRIGKRRSPTARDAPVPACAARRS